MLISKYLAILKANMIDGLYLPFSKEPIVCRDTSSEEAKSSCLIPLCFRNSSKRFFTLPPRSTESLLSFCDYIIAQISFMSSMLSVSLINLTTSIIFATL